MPLDQNLLARLNSVVADTVAPAAADVDKNGEFPAQSIAALTDAGVLGATVPEEFGGGGAALDTASEVVAGHRSNHCSGNRISPWRRSCSR